MKRAQIFGCLVVVLGLPGLARAGLVTWEFGGTVTTVSDSTGFLAGTVAVGSPFSGSFTFDSSTLDSNPDPGGGTYEDAITGISGQIGGVKFLGSAVGDNFIAVQNNLFGLDAFSASSVVDVFDEATHLGLSMTDASQLAFSNDLLPLVPPDLDSFGVLEFSVASETVPFSVGGELTFLVPEPSTLAYLAFGCLACRKRRAVTFSRRARAAATTAWNNGLTYVRCPIHGGLR